MGELRLVAARQLPPPSEAVPGSGGERDRAGVVGGSGVPSAPSGVGARLLRRFDAWLNRVTFREGGGQP